LTCAASSARPPSASNVAQRYTAPFRIAHRAVADWPPATRGSKKPRLLPEHLVDRVILDRVHLLSGPPAKATAVFCTRALPDNPVGRRCRSGCRRW
jgi:hypothetical protein